MENGCVMVWTTIGRGGNGAELASLLVGERLAACVNLLPEMDSIYRWQGKVEIDRERQVVIKTTARRVAELETRIRQLHEYEVPEFIVLPIIGGSAAYLRWIEESTAE